MRTSRTQPLGDYRAPRATSYPSHAVADFMWATGFPGDRPLQLAACARPAYAASWRFRTVRTTLKHGSELKTF